MKFDKSKVCVAGLHEVKEGTKGYCTNTMTQLERYVSTESKQALCVIYDTQDGYYCVRGKDYNFDGTMFYPAPEKQYRPFETIEEARVLKGKWIRSKDGKKLIMITEIYIGADDNELYIKGYRSFYIFENYVLDETGEPVGVEV